MPCCRLAQELQEQMDKIAQVVAELEGERTKSEASWRIGNIFVFSTGDPEQNLDYPEGPEVVPFCGFYLEILQGNPKKELLRGVWVVHTSAERLEFWLIAARSSHGMRPSHWLPQWQKGLRRWTPGLCSNSAGSQDCFQHVTAGRGR